MIAHACWLRAAVNLRKIVPSCSSQPPIHLPHPFLHERRTASTLAAVETAMRTAEAAAVVKSALGAPAAEESPRPESTKVAARGLAAGATKRVQVVAASREAGENGDDGLVSFYSWMNV